MRNKLLLVLAFVLTLTAQSFAYDFSAVCETGQTLYYNVVSNDTVEVTYPADSPYPDPWEGYNVPTGSMTIPSVVNYKNTNYKVVYIGSSAFGKCVSLTSVIISEGVKEIFNSAFGGCSNLTSVKLAESVEYVGEYTFSGVPVPVYSSWLFAYMPSSFSGEYQMPNGIKKITSLAFAGSQVTYVKIPDTVVEIGRLAFMNCNNINKPIYNSNFFVKLPSFFSGEYKIPDGIKEVYDRAFENCVGLTNIVLPNSVTKFGDGVFMECENLKQPIYNDNVFAYMPKSYSGDYIIQSGIKQIASYAFEGCDKLTYIVIPNTVTEISDGAFSQCVGLTSVSVPGSVKFIGYDAFSGCNELKTVVLNEGLESIDGFAFGYCEKLESITIPNSVNHFNNAIFYGCESIKNPLYNDKFFVYMPPSITGEYTIPEGIHTLVDDVFTDCSLSVVNMPNSLTTIGQNVFNRSANLTSIEIPNSVTEMNHCFQDCENLKSVIVSSNLSEMYNSSFNGCDNISEVYMSMFIDASMLKFPTSATITFKEIETVSVNVSSAIFKINTDDIQKENFTEYGLYCNGNYFKASDNGNVTVKGMQSGGENWVYPYFKNKFDKLYFNPYSIKITTGELTADVEAKVSPTVLELIGSCNADKEQIIGYSYVVNGEHYDTPIITDLLPDMDYNVSVIAETTAGTAYNTKIFHTTSTVELTTNVPLVDKNGKIMFSATTNLSDYETKAGFEWRKLDAPESLPSSSAYGTIFSGNLEATATIVSTNVYWKARAYYNDVDGIAYYGEWITFDPSEYVVIEPTVHTYPAVINLNNTIDLSGYIVEGSEEIIEQGFEYWIATAPAEINKVESDDMYITLSDYESDTEYIFRAYAKTSAKTYYGEELTFTTPVIEGIDDILSDPDKSNVIVSDILGRIYNIKNWDNIFGELIKGMYILHRGNQSQTLLIE